MQPVEDDVNEEAREYPPENFVVVESLQLRNTWVYLNASLWARWARDAGPECRSHGSVEAADLRLEQPAGRAQRVDARPPERLVGVDVSEPGDRALIEHGSLDGRAPAAEPIAEIARCERCRERLGTEPHGQIRRQLVGLEDDPRPEAANVAVDDVRSVI